MQVRRGRSEKTTLLDVATRAGVSAITVSRVLREPAPGVTLSAFGADGLEFNVGFWIEDPENGQGQVKSEVHLAVLDLLNAEGVEIAIAASRRG